MYIPRSFEELDPSVLFDFIEHQPLGALVTASSQGMFATHLPFIVDRGYAPHGALRGHVARANQHHLGDQLTAEALVIFTGPGAYISPAWYESKQRHGKVVPTWNYVAVHAYGTLRWVDDEAFLRANLEALTARHESGRAHPWMMSDAPADYVASQLRAIVGVELLLTRIEGKWKLSQNRPAADIDGVVAALSASEQAADRAVATLVETRRPPRTASS